MTWVAVVRLAWRLAELGPAVVRPLVVRTVRWLPAELLRVGTLAVVPRSSAGWLEPQLALLPKRES
jgi:hypothetical protein